MRLYEIKDIQFYKLWNTRTGLVVINRLSWYLDSSHKYNFIIFSPLLYKIIFGVLGREFKFRKNEIVLGEVSYQL